MSFAAFAGAKAHLRENGLFMFDCWYGPGVLSDSPVRRIKALRQGEQKLLRIAEPTMHINANLVDVCYQFVVEEGGRAAPAPSSVALQMTGFKMAVLTEWMSEREPDHHSWSIGGCGT